MACQFHLVWLKGEISLCMPSRRGTQESMSPVTKEECLLALEAAHRILEWAKESVGQDIWEHLIQSR